MIATAATPETDDAHEHHDRLMIGRLLTGHVPVASLPDAAVYTVRARDILRLAREIPPTDGGLPDLAEIAGQLEGEYGYGEYIRQWLLDAASDIGPDGEPVDDTDTDTDTGPVDDPLPTYRPYPVDALPAPVARYASEAAGAIGCDPCMVALPLLGCLARAIGNRRVVRIKDTWSEPAVIWSAVVAKSGSQKTPAFDAAAKFLESRQKTAIKEWQEAREQYKRDVATYERDYASWKRSKDGGDPPEEPVPPVCETYYTSDTTIEGLCDRLDDQYDGVTVLSDELSGWIHGISQYKGGKGSDIGHWLSGWSARAIKVDRKGVGTAKKILYCERAAISITGGIQPDVLRDAIGREHRQDGLCQRLLLAFPPPRKVVWSERTVSERAARGMADVFDRLFALPAGVGVEGEQCPIPVDFSRDAKSIWVDRFNSHRAEMADLDEDLTAVWAKLEAYTARLALIFALCEGRETIDADSLSSAITLIDWHANEAKRVYGLFGESDDDREQRELIDLIARRGGRITCRELRAACRRYREAGAADEALTALINAGLGRWEVVPTSRRPRTEFVLASPDTVSPVSVLVSPETLGKSNNDTATAPKWGENGNNDTTLEWSGIDDDGEVVF